MSIGIKDIGSIFSLYKEDLSQSNETGSSTIENGRVLYSLCREALYEIAGMHSGKRNVVLIPAYTCMTVAKPFMERGWECAYYSIDRHLRIDTDYLQKAFAQCKPSIVVAHPYYGMDFIEAEIRALEDLKAKGSIIVVDLTQCIFSEQRFPFVDYYVGSLRKWMPIPDGGFLETTAEKLQKISMESMEKFFYDDFVSMQRDSMYLRGLYFENGDTELKEISRRINREAVLSARKETKPHNISALSYSIMKREDVQYNISRRMANFKYLYDNLKDCDSYQIVCKEMNALTTAPLYFTLYVEDRSELQKRLAAERIYAPVIWPLGCEEMLVSDDVCFIFQHILALPCDQRYDEKDMKRIVEVINSK